VESATSGGSTGRPKLIVSADPAVIDDDADPMLLIRPNGCMVMPGPLYHNGPAVWASRALLAGNHLVLLPRFNAEATLAAIQEHHADIVYLVPTMMKRIWRLPESTRLSYRSLQSADDLASRRALSCVAQAGVDRLLGPEADLRVVRRDRSPDCDGDHGAGVARPSRLGRRPIPGSVSITDDDGNEVGADEMGEVWLRSPDGETTYRYVGRQRVAVTAMESLSDMGRIDKDGYLYLGDRAADMILSGKRTSTLRRSRRRSRSIRSCVPLLCSACQTTTKGNVVHAVVEADVNEVSEEELKSFVAERLVSYKIPRKIEFTDKALRDDAGKVRRGALRAARL